MASLGVYGEKVRYDSTYNCFYNTKGNIISRPGRSQGLLYKQPRDSLIKSVILFLPQLYGAATPIG